MKNFANIFFLVALFVLPSIVQSDYSAYKTNDFNSAVVATESADTKLPENGIYNPLLFFSAEANLSFSTNIPKPEVSEKLQDQFSREALTKTSYPNNTASFITTSSQIDVGLSIKKLIFPFHSFL